MLSLGIEASRAFWTASARRGLPSGSPPPSLAATVIARASFVKSLPRRESTIAFLCLIPAHLECPAIDDRVYPGRAGPGPGLQRTGAHAPGAAGSPVAMPDYEGRQEAEIAAPPEACFAALTDYESLPQWQRALRSVRV